MARYKKTKSNGFRMAFILFSEKTTRFQILNNFSELAAIQYTGMPHGSGLSNPTAQKAVDLGKLKEYEL
jgi:hypothetical protein